MSNDIINCLKRLDRVGAENSKTVQKIKDACIEVGNFIVSNDLLKHIPDYKVYGGCLIDPQGQPIDKNVSRETALAFSKVVHESEIMEEIIIHKK